MKPSAVSLSDQFDALLKLSGLVGSSRIIRELCRPSRTVAEPYDSTAPFGRCWHALFERLGRAGIML